ncbi:MAG: hypothetical protein J6Y20_14520 [Lachnospiraceae bacterium]|nr:hypothetical protein [Lachnospiraceae bacterium]
MANTNTRAKKKPEEADAPVAAVAEEKKPVVVRDIDPEQYVIVRNGFHGKLVYKSSRTGERFAWDGFGSEQEMQLRELRNAKNTSKKFFINNWFMFDEDWIVDYLGVRQFYKNAIRIENFDDVFKKPAGELKKLIAGMSDGQKKSLKYRAIELITSGDIDSRKTISALEEALGIDLIEK